MPRGHFPRSPEHRANIGNALRGKPKTAEHNERNSRGQIGKQISQETRDKIRNALIGRKLPPRSKEHSDKIRIANLNRSTLLTKYGISIDQYEAQRKAGFRWCHWSKHFSNRPFMSRVGVCVDCQREYCRSENLRKSFGIDQGWYDAKLAEQGGVCSICKSADPQNKGMKFFAVDHDHVTGHIRGLLCSKCNNALERFEKFPGWGYSAIAYVDHYLAAGDSLPKAPKPHKKYVAPSRRVRRNYVPAGHVKDDCVLGPVESVDGFSIMESLTTNVDGATIGDVSNA